MIIKAKILQYSPDIEKPLANISLEFPEETLTCQILWLGYQIISSAEDDLMYKIMNMTAISDLSPENKLLCNVFIIIGKIQHGQWLEAGDLAYSIKYLAHQLNEYQILYLLELLIGRIYREIGYSDDAREIYKDVLKKSAEKNILNIMLVSWYFMAELELHEKNINGALEIINKSNIILEKDYKHNIIHSIFFKSFLGVILKEYGETDKSIKCLEQALDLSKKYNLSYNERVCSDIIQRIKNTAG